MSLILLAIGLPLGYWLAWSRWRWKFLVEAVVSLPIVLPPTVLGLYVLIAIGPLSPVGRWYHAVTGGNLAFTFRGLVIGSVLYSLPFAVQPMAAAFSSVDRKLMDASATLGASPWRTFWRIVLPLGMPGVLTGFVLSFAHTLGEFGVVLDDWRQYSGRDADGVDTDLRPSAIAGLRGGQSNRAVAARGLLPDIGDAIWTAAQSQVGVVGVAVSGGPAQTLGVKVRKKLAQPDGSVAAFTLDVEFAVSAGFTILFGASGAGKTTILDCIAGLRKPDAGRVVAGETVLFDSKKAINIATRSRHVGYLFQTLALFPHMTVRQNIEYGLSSTEPS